MPFTWLLGFVHLAFIGREPYSKRNLKRPPFEIINSTLQTPYRRLTSLLSSCFSRYFFPAEGRDVTGISRFPFHRLVVGYDFHFGRDRSGTEEYLQQWCTSREIDAIIVPPLEIGGEPVKSERIRKLLRSGRVSDAGSLLGPGHAIKLPEPR